MADKPLVTTPEWKGAIYLNMWREIEQRYGREAAKEICGKVMLEAGRIIGTLVATRSEETGVPGLAKAWEKMYGVSADSAIELSDERYVFQNNACAALDMWKQAGQSVEDINDMADGYCFADCGFAEGFDPDVRCTHEARLMKGDAYCQWLHNMEK
jgi:L-2-amino-thiazoline-4-carboxylic acid hydrolase